jgi:synaptobrevin homolog YKT6
LTGLAGFVGCKKDYPPRVAFALIDKALEIFAAKTSKEIWMSCSRPIDSPWLKELFRIHKNPAEADSLTRVQQELDETKIVLHKTIESLLERGEKLDDLVSKSNELGILSKEFLKDSRKTNSCCVIQ